MGQKTLALSVGLVLVAAGCGQAQRSATGTQTVTVTTATRAATTPSHASASTQPARFRGVVTVADRARGWVRVRIASSRSVRIYTSRGTSWAGCDWGQMRSGHRVDVRAYRANGAWIASTTRNWNNSIGARRANGSNGIGSGNAYSGSQGGNGDNRTGGGNGYNGMRRWNGSAALQGWNGYGDDSGYGSMMR